MIWRPPDRYRRAVGAIAAELGLRPAPLRLRWFVARRLDHHGADAAPVPDACREAYDYLRAHSLQGGYRA